MIYQEPFISQIEDSQFVEDKVYTEQGLDNFYSLDKARKNILIDSYRLTSDGASPHTIQQFYQMLYANMYYKKNTSIKFIMHSESTVCDISEVGTNSLMNVTFENIYSKEKKTTSHDMVILATGYRQEFPNHLFDEKILKKITKDDDSQIVLSSDYSIQYDGIGQIFLMNGGKHSHGVADPNLSLNAVRAKKILSSISSDFPNKKKQTTIFGGKS